MSPPMKENIPQKKVHCVYFTCAKHFASLFVSLKSLQSLNLRCLGNIYIHIDRDDFLTAGQINRLMRLKLRIIIEKSGRIAHCGEELIAAEIKAFLEVGEEINPEDYIAKIDSDILFVSGDIFLRVLESGKDAVGQLCNWWEPFVYFQGGCYFIKGSLIPEFRNFDKSILPAVMALMNNETALKRGRVCCEYCEDAVIFYFIKTKTGSIILKNFYGPKYCIFSLNRKFSVVHFEGRRDEMIKYGPFWHALIQIRKSFMKTGIVGASL